MDVAPTGDRGRVPEAPGRQPHGFDDVAARVLLTGAGTEGPERPIGEHGPGPGPEILGRHVGAGDLAQVVVDVIGADVVGLAIRVEVLEELLPRQVLASPHDRREAPVPQADLMLLPGLAPEPEPDRGTAHRGVTRPQRGQPERTIETGVLVVADPDEGRLEEPHDGGQDLVARQAGRREIPFAAGADPRQDAREIEQLPELGVVAVRTPARVIAVLLASPGVPTRRLEVTGRIGADPDIGPGGRDGQRADALLGDGIGYRRSVRPAIGEPAARATARDAGSRIGGIAKASGPRGGAVVRFDHRGQSASGTQEGSATEARRRSPRPVRAVPAALHVRCDWHDA